MTARKQKIANNTATAIVKLPAIISSLRAVVAFIMIVVGDSKLPLSLSSSSAKSVLSQIDATQIYATVKGSRFLTRVGDIWIISDALQRFIIPMTLFTGS
jgi:hypothetical protein